jgi:hypothetical protein
MLAELLGDDVRPLLTRPSLWDEPKADSFLSGRAQNNSGRPH